MRILGLDGEVLFTRNHNNGKNLSSNIATKSAENIVVVKGLEVVNGRPEIHFTFPLIEKGHVLAVVDLVMDLAKLAASFAEISQGKFMLFDLQGNLLSHLDKGIEDAYVEHGFDVSEHALEKINYDNKSFSVVSQPLKDVTGKTIAYVVTMSDNSVLYNSQNTSMLAGFVAVLILIIVALSSTKIIFMSAFRPLENMSKVIKNISHNGDFSIRIPIISNDEIGGVATAINDMINTVQNAIAESNHVMNAVANGDFSQRSLGQAKGDLAKLQSAINSSTESVDNTMSEFLKVITALGDGDFSVRIDESVKGPIRNKVEVSMSTLSDVIAQVNNVLAQMAKGDFTQRIEVDAFGELQAMANNLNECTQQTEDALEDILKTLSALAEGDLTQSASTVYEGKFQDVSKATNESLRSVSCLVSETSNSVHNLVDNVNQIYQGSQDLNDRTQRQAASLEETTATMNQIMHAVGQTTDHARTANQLATAARSQADEGAKVMRSTIESMTDIREASHKIEEIIALIDSIAFQTNLLALNAAVEAARAGEHGRGFAVVAGEVRNLAGKSAVAARDIKGLIENAVSAVEQGTERAERSDQSLQTITEGIRKVSDIVAEITAASVEQSHSITQIGATVGEIETVTQQNAALVEESSTASETMKNEASILSGLVSRFKV